LGGGGGGREGLVGFLYGVGVEEDGGRGGGEIRERREEKEGREEMKEKKEKNLTRSERRPEFPRKHQQREVPWDYLTADADWFVTGFQVV
jgi:hypothetical protein